VDPRVARALFLIDQHDVTDVASLAAHVNLSAARFRYLFRLHISTPLAKYLKQRRLSAAEALLRRSFLTVQEISAASGFKSQCHFVREFRKQFGLPPAAYRRTINSVNKQTE
jgi:transcriptional regulator GlxA family with amidase domain